MSFVSLVLLAAAAPTQSAFAEQTIAAIYAPYSRSTSTRASWDYPIWSAEVRHLIAAWQKVIPKDEPDDLDDGDWLCLCQDWNAKRFHATVLATRLLAPGQAEVRVRIDLGEGERRSARFLLKREGAAWTVDDIFASDFPHGLKQALRETIAKDRKR